MEIYIISDTHFGQRSLATKQKSRPIDFEEKILYHWKRMISENDLVIHLGDVVVGSREDWFSKIQELPGNKILVLGNHDRKSVRWYMSQGFHFCCMNFSWQIFGKQILFSHKPILEGSFDLNIHGHLHQGRHPECKYDERHYLIALEKTAYQPLMLKSIVREWERSKKRKKPEINQTSVNKLQ